MKAQLLVAMLAGVALSSAIGCNGEATRDERASSSANEALVRGVFDQQAENAILVEQTVYPHHFQIDGSGLNELGERHLEVIASRYRTAPGRLVVLRGDASPQLHEARVDVVLRRMTDAGVDPGRLSMAAESPGGSGMPSWRIIEIGQGAGASGLAGDGGGSRAQSAGRQQ